MTIKFSVVVIPGLLACNPALAADLYRCDWPDCRTEYRSAQCDLGARQTAVDPENARREQIRRTLEEERQKKRQKSSSVKTES